MERGHETYNKNGFFYLTKRNKIRCHAEKLPIKFEYMEYIILLIEVKTFTDLKSIKTNNASLI